ncbi:MAG: F0F1 ATP synthase subunit A [Bacilli bacterium]
MNTDNILRTDFLKVMTPEFIASMLTMLIICIFCFVVYFKGKKYKPLDKPKGIVSVSEVIVSYADDQVKDMMGPVYGNFGGYIIALAAYIFVGFMVGMIGIPNFIYLGEDSLMNSSHLFAALPNPFTNLGFPLLIGFITLVMIQVNAIKYTHFKYLLRFVEPIPIVGIFTLWVPMISLSLRLFGNAFAGFCLSTLVYGALGNTGWGLILAPAVMPFFHAYFDVFSGFIQTLVFVMISMMDIAQEGPEMEEQMKMINAVSLKTTIADQAMVKD